LTPLPETDSLIDMPIIQRRKFLTLFASTLAAPAVVRATSIMPVKALPPVLEYRQLSPEQISDLLYARMDEVYKVIAKCMDELPYSDYSGNTGLRDSLWLEET
jgi:hypothetical protein